MVLITTIHESFQIDRREAIGRDIVDCALMMTYRLHCPPLFVMVALQTRIVCLDAVGKCPQSDGLVESQANIVGKGKWQTSWLTKTQCVVFELVF